jgi:hypothetical protein
VRIARLTCAIQPSSGSGPTSVLTFDGNAWSAPQSIRGSLVNSSWPAALARYGETLYCLHQDAGVNGHLCALTSHDGERWSAEAVVIRNAMSAAPAPVVVGGKLYVFFQNYGAGGRLSYATTDGSSWSGPTSATVQTQLVLSPTAALCGNAVYVLYGGGTNRQLDGTLRYVTLSGASWQTWSSEARVPLPPIPFFGGPVNGPPSAAVFEGRLFVFFPDRFGQLHCWWLLENGAWEAGSTPPVTGIGKWGTAAVVFEGLLWVLYRTSAGALGCCTFDGERWRTPAQPSSLVIQSEPAATVF